MQSLFFFVRLQIYSGYVADNIRYCINTELRSSQKNTLALKLPMPKLLIVFFIQFHKLFLPANQ